MKTRSHLEHIRFTFVLLLLALLPTVSVPAKAQATGSIEFTAHVAPTDAHPEPVRQGTFYLLNKSLVAIRQETTQLDPLPDMGKFVDGLKASPELKAWMKKHHTVQLSGSEFTKKLDADDIIAVPEFFKAYMAREAGVEGVGFPKPKYKEKDITAHPEKYKQQRAEYIEAIRKFITMVPDTVEGIDADLTEINPAEQWQAILIGQKNRIEKHSFDLAQSRNLVAQTDTDLDGRGTFLGLAPGNYWLGTLGTQAIAGDVRLRWDVPVTVRAGQVARVQLTNLNAMEPESAKSDSNPKE